MKFYKKKSQEFLICARIMRNKKGQSAIEFLMTYGWAFFMAFGFIAALFYFGILDFGGFLPSKCEFASEFDCEGFVIREDTGFGNNDGEVLFKLVNNLGVDIVLQNCSLQLGGGFDDVFPCKDSADNGDAIFNDVELPGGATPEMYACGMGGALVTGDEIRQGDTWRTGEARSFYFGGCDLSSYGLVEGAKEEVMFKFKYRASQSIYSHNITGRIFSYISGPVN